MVNDRPRCTKHFTAFTKRIDIVWTAAIIKVCRSVCFDLCEWHIRSTTVLNENIDLTTETLRHRSCMATLCVEDYGCGASCRRGTLIFADARDAVEASKDVAALGYCLRAAYGAQRQKEYRFV